VKNYEKNITEMLNVQRDTHGEQRYTSTSRVGGNTRLIPAKAKAQSGMINGTSDSWAWTCHGTWVTQLADYAMAILRFRGWYGETLSKITSRQREKIQLDLFNCCL